MPKWVLSTLSESAKILPPIGELGPRWKPPAPRALLTKVDTQRDPSTYNKAQNYPEWEATISAEYEALIKKNIGTLTQG